jgi:triosephosphate isomerase
MAEPRRTLIAGNWKMNLTFVEAIGLADELKRRLGRLRTVDVAVAPSHPYLAAVAKRLDGERLMVGAQDLHESEAGAFTGSVSGEQLKSVGATFVLVGHSERRHVFGDTDTVVRKKLEAALRCGLDVVLCIGEQLAQHEAGQTFEVCEQQLATALADYGAEELAHVSLAYEPVWAIGTGKTAGPAQVQEVHRHVREWMSATLSKEVAERMRILYGGSVKPDNAGLLLSQPDVDGLLVGGASLNIDSFDAIVKSQLHGSF